MYSRNKVLAIESIVVMIVLILMAFVVFLVIRSGAGAYDGIVSDKQNTESARVAYSYINMKIKQNDAASLIDIVDTEYGNTLEMDIGETGFVTYIFFSDGALYECLTKHDMPPKVENANIITKLNAFDISLDNSCIHITCVCENDGDRKVVTGTVGLRT